jgi:hypothetical protein
MTTHSIQEADTSAVNIDEFLFVTVKQGIEDLVFITDDGGNSFAIPKGVLEAFITRGETEQKSTSVGKLTVEIDTVFSEETQTLMDLLAMDRSLFKVTNGKVGFSDGIS